MQKLSRSQLDLSLGLPENKCQYENRREMSTLYLFQRGCDCWFDLMRGRCFESNLAVRAEARTPLSVKLRGVNNCGVRSRPCGSGLQPIAVKLSWYEIPF